MSNGATEMVSRMISLDAYQADDTGVALDYWRARCRGAFAPAWIDVDLMALPPQIIPRIMVLDVVQDPLDFVYRFFGTWHVLIADLDMTGKRISDYSDPKYRDVLMKQNLAAVRTRKPQLFDCLLPVPPGERFRSEILRMPLSDDGEQVTGVLAAEALLDGETGPSPISRDRATSF